MVYKNLIDWFTNDCMDLKITPLTFFFTFTFKRTLECTHRMLIEFDISFIKCTIEMRNLYLLRYLEFWVCMWKIQIVPIFKVRILKSRFSINIYLVNSGYVTYVSILWSNFFISYIFTKKQTKHYSLVGIWNSPRLAIYLAASKIGGRQLILRLQFRGLQINWRPHFFFCKWHVLQGMTNVPKLIKSLNKYIHFDLQMKWCRFEVINISKKEKKNIWGCQFIWRPLTKAAGLIGSP